jgi:uncharacterized protein YndB with AHSA1/START domain
MQVISARSNESSTADRELVFTRVFDAPRELVFEAWTDPTQITNWWGPRGFTTTTEKFDFRAGGQWIHTMHGPDGTDYPNRSIFTEVDPPERIAYTHASSTTKDAPGVNFHLTVDFEEWGRGTRIRMHMVFATAAIREETVRLYHADEGARQMLERLAEFLAAKGVTA